MIIKGRVRSIWRTQKREVSQLVENICGKEETCQSKKDKCQNKESDDHSQDKKEDNDQNLASSGSLLDIDLNYPPYSHDTKEELENRQIVEEKKRRRATTKDVAKIDLADLSKYFDLTITEASKRMNIGLTVLKRKCREFGIPRWPHRKIKSLDNLILELKEEKDRQDQVCASAAIAVLKRQRMLETEKENIEKKPSMDIQKETKRFRQDVFKRKHYARTRGKKVDGESKAGLSLRIGRYCSDEKAKNAGQRQKENTEETFHGRTESDRKIHLACENAVLELGREGWRISKMTLNLSRKVVA